MNSLSRSNEQEWTYLERVRSWPNFQISFAAQWWKYCEMVDPWTVHELYRIPQIIATRVIIYSSWFICKSMQTKERPFWNFIPEKPLTDNVPFLGASQPGVLYLMNNIGRSVFFCDNYLLRMAPNISRTFDREQARLWNVLQLRRGKI